MKKYMLALGLSLLTVLGLFTGLFPEGRDGFGFGQSEDCCHHLPGI